MLKVASPKQRGFIHVLVILVLLVGLAVSLALVTSKEKLNFSPKATTSNDNHFWKGNGLEITTVAAIAVDPTDSNKVYFGYWDQGFLKSIDGGNSFKMSNASVYGYDSNGNYPGTRSDGGNVFAITIDPDNPSIIYAANNMWKKNDGVVSRSTDYGETWTTIGSTSNGLANGNIRSIALDKSSPLDSRTMYVSSKDNGIYKTTNGGTSWSGVLNTASIAAIDPVAQSHRARTVAIDPNNSQIVYAGFEAIRHSDPTPTDLGGLYRSTNGGSTWSKVAKNLTASVFSIAIDPKDSQTIYAATAFAYDPGIAGNTDHPTTKTYQGGVIKSTDGGLTWIQTLSYSSLGVDKAKANAAAIVVNPVNQNVYVSFSNDPYFDEYKSPGIWKSSDKGAHWTEQNNGLSLTNAESLAVDAKNPSIIYAGSRGNGAFKGTDSASGINWSSIGPGGGGYMPTVAIVPSANDASRVIYAGCNVGGFYKSTDGGATYQILNNGLKNYDVEGLVYDPGSPNTIYIITPGGPYKSTDGGANWQQKRSGFPSANLWNNSKPLSAIALDPSDSKTLYVGVGTWFEDTINSGSGKGEVWRSTNGADSWSKVNTGIDPTAAILKIAVDPKNSNIVYAATDKGLYKSTNKGINWASSNTGLPNYQGASVPYVRNIVIDPTDASTLYSVLYTKPNTSTKYPWLGGVYKSTDSGASWTAKISGLAPDNAEINRTTSDRHTTRNYLHLVINPKNTQELYLGSTAWWGAGIYKSTNGGNSWAQSTLPGQTNIDHYADSRWIAGGLPAVESLAIDSINPQVIFFSSVGLFNTTDAGQNWRQAHSRLVNPSVSITNDDSNQAAPNTSQSSSNTTTSRSNTLSPRPSSSPRGNSIKGSNTSNNLDSSSEPIEEESGSTSTTIVSRIINTLRSIFDKVIQFLQQLIDRVLP